MAKVKLGDIAETALGKMLDAKKNKGEQHPYLANIHVRWGEFDLVDLPLMRFEDSEAERFSLQDGDLVMCEGGEPGRCAIWREQLPDMRYQKALHRIRPHENVDVRWLYYWFLLQGRIGGLNKYFVETTIKHLVGADLRTVEIDLPELDKQITVADVLATIDDKIANNKNLIAELEATARLIYDYWFTQFDFPDENGKPYRSSGGKMIWSDELKRSIPNKWTIGTLGDYLHLEKDTVTPTPGHTYEHYSIPAFDDGKFPTLDDGGSIESGKYRVQKGCILYSKLNPKFKRLWRPYCLTDDAICSTEFLVMQPDAPQYQGFCISILYSPAFYAHMVSKAISSTGSRSRVDPDVAISFAFARPADKLIERYGAHVMPLFSQIQELEIENHELANMRDWLLPMLMNGQATIGE